MNFDLKNFTDEIKTSQRTQDQAYSTKSNTKMSSIAQSNPSMALPAKLSPAPSDREAIADTLARFCLGMDTNDVELFDSAFTIDAFWDLSGKKVNGLDAIHKECYYYNIVRLDTTHMVSNTRIDIDATGETATMTCLYVAWHWPGGQGMHPDSHRFTTGGSYFFDVVKDSLSGLWKAKTFRMKKQWSEGDIAVMGHKKPVEMLKTELESVSGGNGLEGKSIPHAAPIAAH